jgi:alkylation response protein AidB-like acyl-CoA dehydrogenase
MNLSDRFRALLRSGALELPAVGRGRTSERHLALRDFGREDLSLARVVEAHTDATAILAEAGRRPRVDALYGVWAADGPKSQLSLVESAGGELILRGVKQYCSGAGFLNAALVTAHHDDDLLLIDVPLADGRITVDTSSWTSPAFAATTTGTATFGDVRITREQIVGGAGWYLQRPGFWHGAVGPAACWAGGAVGLVDAARNARRDNPHGLAHLGALEALSWGMTAVLDRAGREIDADPLDELREGRRRALSARHLIERSCTEVMDRFGRATGPALLAFDPQVAQRYAELTLYVRQCHAERDLQDLATHPPPR